jgi:uncharacterized protein YndB with AHSA1/START domain
MTEAAMKIDSQDIVVEEVFPHAPETIWKALTTGALMERWLGLKPAGFEPVKDSCFTYQTTPAGAWNGLISCEVLEVKLNERLAYAWRGGHEANEGYGSRLDTVVTFSLAKVANGTRVRLVHSGFVLPKNATALKNMSEGWKKVVDRIGAIANEQEAQGHS